ncbi:MAG: hypothetical protein JWM05_3671 [Acidimicrobiales bacterium]|nr:hypothetical protein [Acidimicrobiales bacterium]
MRSRAARGAALVLLGAAAAGCGTGFGAGSSHDTTRPGPSSRTVAGPTSTSSTTTTTAPRPPGPPRVLVFGDSLVALTKDALDRQLRAAGWVPTIVGIPGWRLDQLLALYRPVDLEGKPWDAVVGWAGNNDALQDDPWRADLDQEVGRISDVGCGVVVGISQDYWALHFHIPKPFFSIPSPEAVAFNREAEALATRRHLAYVRWQDAIHVRQPYFYWDLIHVTPLGAEYAAGLITRAVAPCLP